MVRLAAKMLLGRWQGDEALTILNAPAARSGFLPVEAAAIAARELLAVVAKMTSTAPGSAMTRSPEAKWQHQSRNATAKVKAGDYRPGLARPAANYHGRGHAKTLTGTCCNGRNRSYD